MVRGRSAMPYRDQQTAVELATSVRDEMRRWAGPSENAHRLIVQERMLVGAFLEVITLATPTAFGGQANDREAVDPTVAIMGTQASVALGDRTRAGRFGDAMRDTPIEPLIRAIAADPNQPHAKTLLLWRTALDNADSPLAARICLHQLAARGTLDAADLTRFGTLAKLDDQDRTLFTARNTAAAGDLDSAITLLRSQRSPAAGEMLIELLREAGRYDEAIAACDETWTTYGALKALQDKINILAVRGDIDGAEACAAQLLATGELASEQRRQLHNRLIERRAMQAEKPVMPRTARPQPFVVAYNPAPISGPASRRPCRTVCSAPFASASRSSGITSLIKPLSAALTKMYDRPRQTATAKMIHRSVRPSTANSGASMTADPTRAVTRNGRRRKRSTR
jgi:hypothetical protein